MILLSFFTLWPLGNKAFAIIAGLYSGLLTDYDIVLPRKIRENGAFYSFDLKEDYGRERRSPKPEDVHLRVRLEERDEHLELRPEMGLTSAGMVVEEWYGRNLSERRCRRARRQSCHYRGTVRGSPGSRLALSLCDGILGHISFNGTLYQIEPLAEAGSRHQDRLHLVYKRSAAAGANSCQSPHNWWDSWAQELFRSMKTSSSAQVKRERRSDDNNLVPRYLELCVVSDFKFVHHHKAHNVEEYVLSILNMVADFFHDESIGTLIDIVVVRLVFLYKDKHEFSLNISDRAETSLESFCHWQMRLNPKDGNHPNHHDMAVLLTRHDLCSEGKAGCNLLGMTYLGTVCNPRKSCSINEDTGLTLATTLAHEIGHSLGCAHDTLEESGCDGKLSDSSLTIMAPLSGTSHSTTWSNCSRAFISNMVFDRLGDCLLDEPIDHESLAPEMPIGALYDADMQCKFIFNEEYVHCDIGGEQSCEQLWCKKEGTKKCLSRGEPMADGTSCGAGFWCYRKKCVPLGLRPPAVDGNWSDWGGWTPCSRSCGGGVSLRERICNNPPPKNGGRYCPGNKRGFTICNRDDCGEGVPTFRESQCKEHNFKPYRGQLHAWVPYSAPESDPNPCALYCINEQRTLVKLEARVKDGTRCYPGKKNTCIHGTCIIVDCDWGIESGAVEDICGICNGDGTKCHIIHQMFNDSDGADYVKITTIPKGSTNIIINELDYSENMLAVGSNQKEIYFNGNYTERLPGEYKIGGVPALYTKPEKGREEIHIKGPLKEDVILYYVYFKKENPGIEVKYSELSAEQSHTPMYRWEFADWGRCSAACGGGTQVSRASCVEVNSGKVSDKYCNEQKRPEPKKRSCNMEKCKAKWKVLPWGPCSGCMYKTGMRRREVECVVMLPGHSSGDILVVLDSECPSPKPASVEPCNSSRPCNSTCSKNDRRRRWGEEELDIEFQKHNNRLAGIDEEVREFLRKRSTDYKEDLEECPDQNTSGPVVLDALPTQDFILKTVLLTETSNTLLGKMSEMDFQSVGGKVQSFSMGIPEIYKGEEAIKIFQDAMVVKNRKPIMVNHSTTKKPKKVHKTHSPKTHKTTSFKPAHTTMKKDKKSSKT